MQKIKLGIISMGCDKNTHDTEAFLSSVTPYADFVTESDAEYIFLNTCAFLQSARAEMEEYLQEFQDKKIILAGCFRNLCTPEFLASHPQVIGWADPKTDSDFLSKFLTLTGQKNINQKPQLITTQPSHSFVKIAEGCNRKCSFCLIPYLTGAYRSREMADILDEIKTKVQAGIPEIILVAQDTGIYGHDLKSKTTITELLKKIEAIQGNFWIRILYLYPNGITDDLLGLIAKSEKILPYFDFPLQHFSPQILTDMNRPQQDNSVINKIKKHIPDAVLRTTVMVAYPTETEQDFDFLCKKLEDSKIDHTSVFIYSSEPHTEAGKLDNPHSQETKTSRENKILRIGYKNRQEFFKKILHTDQTCIVDDIQDGIAMCRSWHFAPSAIDGYIYAEATPDLHAGDIVDLNITHTEYENIYAKIL